MLSEAHQKIAASMRQDRWSDAEAACRALAAAEPDAFARRILGCICREKWQLTEAQDWLAQALALQPGDPMLYFHIGAAQRLAGQLRRAEHAFGRATALAPADRLFRDALADTRSELDNTGRPDADCVLVSFATAEFARAQRGLARSALDAGRFTGAISWDPARLAGTALHSRNASILREPRGAGYWLWKPYIILEALVSVPDGAFVVYSDCGPGEGYRLRQSIAPLLRWCAAHGGMLPGVVAAQHGRNARWTKRDCFHFMGCDEERFWSAPHLQATYSVWQKTAATLDLARRWLELCCDRTVLTDDPNVCGKPNFADFVDHRHDQSVLTNLWLLTGVKALGPSPPWPKDINAAITAVNAGRAVPMAG